MEELELVTLPAQFAPESEQVEIFVDADVQEGMQGEAVSLRDHAIERLQVVAEIMAKSVILAVQEATVAHTIAQVEPFALDLQQKGRPGRHARELLRYLGESLLNEHRIVGRVEVTDKPELLWERPNLEGLYLRLEEEFEIRERHLALEHKLELISRTVRTVLDLIHDRRSLRVEWYIVILIVAEIALTLYELFFH